MTRNQRPRFEPAPDLPGSDRAAKYILGAINFLVDVLWDVEIDGRSNVPTSGPAIICPNHLSFCDSVFVPFSMPRRIWAIGKGEYMDDWKTKHLFPALGMIPVDRSGGAAAQVALDAAANVLDSGKLFMIYPEGTRSRSGRLHKGRTGPARLAIRCNAPIIPVGHRGTVDIQPPDTFMMKPFKQCTVRIGEPMWPSDYGNLDDPKLPRNLTDSVMFEIARLSGQTYDDTYAGSRKEATAEPAARPLPPAPASPTPARPPARPQTSITRPGPRPTRPTRPSRTPSTIDLRAQSEHTAPRSGL